MEDKKQPAITKEILTYEEIFCIARHMQRYVEVLMHEDPDFPDPCCLCPMSPECVKRHFEFGWETILKLKDITGVYMSPGRRRKIK